MECVCTVRNSRKQVEPVRVVRLAGHTLRLLLRKILLLWRTVTTLCKHTCDMSEEDEGKKTEVRNSTTELVVLDGTRP